jgi:co-chaperonin GroES (HSP10)
MELPQVPAPIKDKVFILADKDKNARKQLGDTGVEILIDTAFEPHATENVTQEGIVLQPPSRLSSGKKVEIERGDYVYTHHFLCDDDQQIEHEGQKFFQLIYEYVHCKVKDGEITMVGDWNLIEPWEEPEEVTPAGIILPNFDKPETPNMGIARHITDYMKDLGVEEGDKVYFTKNSDYEMIVEGVTYWRMRDQDIIGIAE